MAKPFNPAVLTANDLIEGHSVFLTPEGWAADIAGAMIAVTPQQADELAALGRGFSVENDVIEPYLVDVSLKEGTPIPVLRREQIRASGAPTISIGKEGALRPAA